MTSCLKRQNFEARVCKGNFVAELTSCHLAEVISVHLSSQDDLLECQVWQVVGNGEALQIYPVKVESEL